MLDFFKPPQGGGDVFDIARVCRGLEPGDKAAWERAWLALAESTEAKAKKTLAGGHQQSAMQNFFHANQYYRMSDVFLGAEDKAKKTHRFIKSQENFRAAAKLHVPPIEIITVRCGNEEYEGYFCHPINPRRGPWPAVFLIGGADAFSEEIFFSGRQVLEPCCWLTLPAGARRCTSRGYLRATITRPRPGPASTISSLARKQTPSGSR